MQVQLHHLSAGHHWDADSSGEWRPESRQRDAHSRPGCQAPLDTSDCLRSHVQALATGWNILTSNRCLRFRQENK